MTQAAAVTPLCRLQQRATTGQYAGLQVLRLSPYCKTCSDPRVSRTCHQSCWFGCAVTCLCKARVPSFPAAQSCMTGESYMSWRTMRPGSLCPGALMFLPGPPLRAAVRMTVLSACILNRLISNNVLSRSAANNVLPRSAANMLSKVLCCKFLG